MPDSQIDYSVTLHDNVCVVKINESRLDTSNAPAFKTELLRLVAGGAKRFLINLQKVKTINSSGLGSLTFGKRQLDEVGGEFSFCCVQEKVQALFRIAKLDRVFTIYDTEEEGLQKF